MDWEERSEGKKKCESYLWLGRREKKREWEVIGKGEGVREEKGIRLVEMNEVMKATGGYIRGYRKTVRE